ncbi:MAG: homoserine kinase [Gemmatimonadaceae bacterium]
MTFPDRIAALAPPSIGNFGPGLDILGCAVEGAADIVVAERAVLGRGEGNVTVLDAGHSELPTDPARHAAAIAARAVLSTITALGVGVWDVALRCRKRLPLAAGQGGSAASAVAGAVAVNALFGGPLGETELLRCALDAEATVAGRHLDNIAPCLMGGFVLVRSLDPIDVVRLPTPASLHIVLAYPRQRLRTAEARAVLPASVPRSTALHQAAQVAGIVAALFADDLPLLGRSIDDRIAEPARVALLPGFAEAKDAALAAGALGASISGAGPTAFAIAATADIAERVAAAMTGAYRAHGMDADAWVTRPGPGARIVDPRDEGLDA